MSYELDDVVRRLEEGRNRRRRPSEERWRNLNHLENEEVVELTALAYENASERIHSVVKRMSEDEQDNIMLGVSPLFTGVATSLAESNWDEETIAPWYDARLDLRELVESYTFIADYAYHKFVQEASEGRPGMLLGLIRTMQDPVLAKRLLQELSFATMPTHTSSYATERAAEATSIKGALKSYAKQERMEEVRTKLTSSDIGILGALLLKRQTRIATQKRKGINKSYEANIINPLQQIRGLPPVSIQLLYRALGGKPKN
jgi:hypothetical protein